MKDGPDKIDGEEEERETRGILSSPSPSLAKRVPEVRLRSLEPDNLMHALSRDTNEAHYGAAISNRGTLSIAGSAFTGKIAQESGGAVYATRSTSGNQVEQSCFEGNTARFGGAVFSSASGFNARDNWWGVATKAMVNANVLTEPFLTDGCPQ